MTEPSETTSLLDEQSTPRIVISGPRAGRASLCCLGSRIAGLILVAGVVAAGIAVAVMFTRNPDTHNRQDYSVAAVISDQKECSKIGSDIMRVNNGSAVDAAIATLFCIGVTGTQASGIGGGHFMTIYDTPRGGTEKEVSVINAREMAPAAAFRDMFNGTSSGSGGLSIAVPGEVRGMHEAWSRFGRLPWKQLIEPTIEMCENGFQVSDILSRRMKSQEGKLDKFPSLRGLITKPDGSIYKPGDIMRRPVLANSLRRLAIDGPETFYSGTLAEDILRDLEDAGSIITRDDLRNYRSKVDPAFHVPVANKTLDLYVPLLPSGGPVLQFILKVLEGFPCQDINLKRNVDFHQAVAETFKFAFALRSYLGDDDFVDTSEAIHNMTTASFISHVQSRVDLAHTHDFGYYGSAYLPAEDHGTAHLSVVSPDGAAVAVTSSINTYFGSKEVGQRTGIVFNDEMDDFSSPTSNDFWGIRPSPANFIEPGKRPLSSMTPIIVVDHTTKKPRLVIGGAGGSKISTMIAFVTHLNLMCGVEFQKAIDFPRIHHQFLPNVLDYESDVQKDVVVGLHEKGHVMSKYSSMAVINGIARQCTPGQKSCYYTAMGDPRRGGVPHGWN